MFVDSKIRVTFYHRKRSQHFYSIENLFDAIRYEFSENIECAIAESKFPSQGIFNRLYNTIEACFHQSDINHITGDVHYLAYFLLRRKTLLTITDCVSLRRLSGLKQKLLLFFWYWLPLKRCALLTVISEASKQEIMHFLKIDERKIRVVHCCVSPQFKPCPKLWNEDKPIILQVGTTPNKNIAKVAEALQGIQCHLRIIGPLSGEQIRELERHHIEYSSVAAISNEQVVKEYRHADMVVFASTYEGFGLPIIEGQAIGRPVLTSNLLSMPEVAGGAACLVDPISSRSIREGLKRIISNAAYREELVKKGLKNVERFRPHEIAKQYEAIYKELNGQRAQRF